jgi:methionyl-tRNA synthetase
MSTSDHFYVTTPIYYVNDVPHIGHAYTTLAADTLARWNELCGRTSFFLTGTDEHGLKIEQAARKAGITPQEHADRYAQPFRELTQTLDVRNHDFIRTTEPRHQKVVQDMWARMEQAGDIYLSTYAGWYSVSDEAYFTEDEIVDGKAPSGHDVVWMEEESYFFRLSQYTDRLLAYFKDHPHFVQPQSRANEILRFIEQGLQDISISRTSFKWGVPIVGNDQHVTYVWVDALTNYISALGGPDGDLYAQYWPKAVHLIGKDIL